MSRLKKQVKIIIGNKHELPVNSTLFHGYYNTHMSKSIYRCLVNDGGLAAEIEILENSCNWFNEFVTKYLFEPEATADRGADIAGIINFEPLVTLDFELAKGLHNHDAFSAAALKPLSKTGLAYARIINRMCIQFEVANKFYVSENTIELLCFPVLVKYPQSDKNW